MAARAHRTSAGQATLEWIGLVVLVALLGAVVAPWLVRSVHPPDHPPRVVEAAAMPLQNADSWVAENVDPIAGLEPWSIPRGVEHEPIGDALRAARDAVAFAARLPAAFGRGFVDRAIEDLRRLARDPLATAIALTRNGIRLATDPEGLVQDTLDGLVDYVDELRSRGWREALLQLAHDAGEQTFELALSRGTAVLRKAIVRRVVERLRAGGGPGAAP
jgi:hypothetical protein